MSKQISLKNMLAEGFAFDVNTEKNSFEASVASATESAKKKFEDSMKQKVVGQKVKVRASRGQPGQPEKDYVIEKVSAANIDWYWKQYVVVFKDEKNKEFFLKPGFKVEVLTATQPGQQPSAQAPAEPAKQAPAAPAAKAPPASPTGGAGVAPQAAGAKNATKAPVAENDDEIPHTSPEDKEEERPENQSPVDELEGVPNSYVDESQKEYKKEWAAQILGDVLWGFLSPEIQKSSQGRNLAGLILPYIKSSKWISTGESDPGDGDRAEWILQIPEKDMIPELDLQDFKMTVRDELRSSSGPGEQYTRGYADIQKIGRFYRIKIEYTVGSDV